MPVDDTERLTTPEAWCQRLTAMGLEARVMRGGRAVIANLPLTDAPFPGIERGLRLKQAMLATVGAYHVKCLKPESLFALPMIDVRSCSRAQDIEARIRSAWRERMDDLGECWEELRNSGTRAQAQNPDSVIRFALDGESEQACGRMIAARKVILPSRGPLGGKTLRTPEARVLDLRQPPATASELQIAVSNELESLAEQARRTEAAAREARLVQPSAEMAVVGVRNHCVLLVGPKLTRDQRIFDSLSLRGYSVVIARSAIEATRLYQRCSPELVITEADLGRAEGLELIPMLRALDGIENIPVIVVDDQMHEGRRQAAKQIGAVGYIAGGLNVARISDRLSAMLNQPKQRRFTRYARPIAVRVIGALATTTATELSRGGIYVTTNEDFPANTLQRCELVLADTGQRVEVEAEVLYRLGNAGRDQRGVGLRFDRFGADGEAEYLEFLRSIAA